MLDDKSFVSQHKSAILQAVETMYDDEYDDTYDSMGLNSTGADFKLVDDIDARADEGATRQAGGRAQMVCIKSLVLGVGSRSHSRSQRELRLTRVFFFILCSY